MQARDSEWANRTKAQNMEIALNSGLIKEVASSHVVLILEVEEREGHDP